MTNSGILTTGIFFLLVILLRVFLFKTPIPCNTYDTLWKIAILKALLPELKSKLSIYNYFHNSNQNLYISQVEITPNTIVNVNNLNIKLLLYWCVFFLIILIIIFDYIKAYKLVHTTELTKVEGIAKLGYGNVKTPVTIGIIKQYIIFPYYIKNIGENEFRLVLLHEIIHIRRADNFWKLLSFITIAKFWYNPIVWLGIKLFFKDMEICVDYKVINTTKVEPYLYASLLISTAKLAQSQYNVFSNFTSAKTLNERLNKIMNYKKKSILSTLSACILITFVATACGTSKVASQEVVYSDEAIISTNLTEHGLKSEETYIINDQNKNFILKNGCALIFTKEEKWKLEKGEKAALEIALANTEFNIEVGYIKDNGNMNLLFSGLPKSTQTVELIAPDDGNYAFYLLGISSDAVQVKQVSLKVGNSLNLHIDNHIGGNQHEKENF